MHKLQLRLKDPGAVRAMTNTSNAAFDVSQPSCATSSLSQCGVVRGKIADSLLLGVSRMSAAVTDGRRLAEGVSKQGTAWAHIVITAQYRATKYSS